jgi:hypothetical protein
MIPNYYNFLYLSSLSFNHSLYYSTITNNTNDTTVSSYDTITNNSNDSTITNNLNETIITTTNNSTTITSNNNYTLTNNFSENNEEKVTELKKMIKSGYAGYENLFELGLVDELLEESNLGKSLSLFKNELDDDKVYTVLVVLRYFDYTKDLVRGSTIGKSLKVHKNIRLDILIDQFGERIQDASTEYSLPDDAHIILMYREWLSPEQYRELKMKNINIIDILSDELKKGYRTEKLDTLTQIKKRIDLKKYSKSLNIKPGYYGDLFYESNGVKFYKFTTIDGVKVEKLNEFSNKITMIKFEKNDIIQDFVGLEWVDRKTDSGYIREMNNKTFYFNNDNQIENFNIEYSFPTLPEKNIEQTYDDKIGSFDLETYSLNEKGEQVVYSGGWATKDKCQMFYIGDENCSNAEDLVKSIFKDIFDNNNDGYTFYAHNLSKFDAIFLLKCLRSLDFKLSPKFKDNGVFMCKITNTFTKKSIKILDSQLIFNTSLREVCKNFNTVVQKGIFPYKFVNKDNLFYIGDKPAFKYYRDINKKDWDEIPNNNWNIKTETLKYLKSDLIGLLDSLFIFSNFIFNKYNANVTNYPTLPSLARGVYLSKFHKYDYNIKIIKGGCESDIRSGYYAGLNQIFHHEIKHGFMYDMVSQYPYVMKNFPMPVGNPTLTIEKNLEKIFGWSYCRITAPTKKRLKNLILPVRTNKGVEIGHGTFYGWYFSEELKFAVENGYKVQVICSLNFSKGYNIFDNYVNEFFNMKIRAEEKGNLVERSIAKLMLNSLYGGFGMNEIIDTLKFVDKEKAKEIIKFYNYSLFSQIDDDTYIVKYSTKLSENLQKLLKESGLEIENSLSDLGLAKRKGVQSAVQIAAAITAWGRVSINKFKNDPNNKAIMSATDSLVCEKELPESVVGKDLGQMKLERKIAHGIFIRKNVYGLLLENGEFISKCGGLGKNKLTYEEFKLLLSGENLIKTREIFKVNWEKLSVKIFEIPFTINGIKKEIVPLDFIYKNYDLKEIEAPQLMSCLLAPKNIVKGPNKPIDSKLKTGAKNNISDKNVTHIDSLINNLMELDKKIENLEIKINKLKKGDIMIKIYESYKNGHILNRGSILRELVILGIKNPYGYIEKIENKELNKKSETIIENKIEIKNENKIKLPEIIYLNGPKNKALITPDYKLLLAPNYKLLLAPNYKLLLAPNYKLLEAPKIIINNDDNNNGKINKNNLTINKLQNWIKGIENEVLNIKDLKTLYNLIVNLNEIEKESYKKINNEGFNLPWVQSNAKLKFTYALKWDLLKDYNKINKLNIINENNWLNELWLVNFNIDNLNSEIWELDNNNSETIYDRQLNKYLIYLYEEYKSYIIKILKSQNKKLTFKSINETAGGFSIIGDYKNYLIGNPKLIEVLNTLSGTNKKFFKNENSPFSSKISKRQLSTRVNNNIDIFNPILKVQDELLAPIIINDNVSFQMEKIKFILSRVPDSNLVKAWLKMELETNNIIISAIKNEGIDESLLKEVKEIKTFEIEEPDMFNNNPWPIIIQDFYKIKRNNFHYDNSCKEGLFTFIDAEIKLNEILSKETTKNSLYTCCYIIIFKNKYYYYIGSTTHIKDRLKTHSKNINHHIEHEDNTLNQIFKYFIDSEINYLKNRSRKKGKKTLDFRIKILYLSTNYLNKFKKTHPDYELSKGEWILLYMITDFIIKTLEESLIIEYLPKLNMINKVKKHRKS